jgi:parvulin-like peptidyl-prolyl isomerase
MKWHRLASAVMVGFLAGCQAEHPALAGDPTPAPDNRPVSLAAPVRSQKPDVRQTVFEAVNAPFPALQNGEVTLSVRAHVNGVPIFDDEIKEICYPALISLPPSLSESERAAKQAQVFREGLQQIIDREIILQDAFARLSRAGGPYLEKLKTAAGKEFDKTLQAMRKRSGAKSDDDFKEMLRSQGQTIDGIRRQFERNFMAREYMRSRIFPMVERATGHQQIQEYYQEHPGEFQAVDGVKWQDIFIDAGRYRTREEARAFAEGLADRARKGEDFTKLMKYDNGDSSYRNGEGFGQRRGEIKPTDAEPVLFQMQDGQVGPLIEIPTGFHVIRLVKRTRAGLLPLDEKLQNDIRRKLQNLVVERETKKLLDELKQKATVEIDRHPSGQ